MRAAPRRRVQTNTRPESSHGDEENHVVGVGEQAAKHGDTSAVPIAQVQKEVVDQVSGGQLQDTRVSGFSYQQDIPMEIQIGDKVTGEGKLFFGRIEEEFEGGYGCYGWSGYCRPVWWVQFTCRHGYGGGLALLWDSSVTVHIQSYSNYHIDAKVFQDDGGCWRLTGFYGHSEVSLRCRTWELLRRLHAVDNQPWIVFGDFNETISLDEQCGREDRSLIQMANFREALVDCELQDLGFQGPEFTWSNRRLGGRGHMRRHKLFRFEHAWLRETGCETTIADAWKEEQVGTAMVSYDAHAVNILRKEVTVLLAKEEVVWRQRSRVNWLTDGDQNTNFFHEYAGQRKRTNTIQGLRDNEDIWRTDLREVEQIAIDYFNTLFTSSRPTAVEEVVQVVESVVTPDINEDLLRPFSPDEVKQALFQMHPSKSPGPDVLVSRMKKVLPRVISESQSAFVPGRMITDNVIIAFEAIHHLKNLRGGKNAQMAAKLDMSKAYDRVEWDYLRAVLVKLGFHERAKLSECSALQDILTLYGKASGQVINGDKTAIFFSHNTPSSLRVDISGFFGTTLTTKFEKYFGVTPNYWKSVQWPTNSGGVNRNGGRKIHWMNKKNLYRSKHDGGMGFRDLQLFNSALLARQGWRLLHNSTSLVFRVLKAKYFPHSSFLDACVPHNASFTWRSICDAKEVLKSGLRWRVGTGEHIQDLEGSLGAKDVELILKIPLSCRRPPDVLIWAGTKRGIFSVQVPPKVKLFIWKACQNIIPTQTKLFEKGITHLYSCLWCEDEPETSDHVLWGCEFAQKVWNSCPVPIGIHQRSLKLFTDVIGSFISDLQTPVIEIAFTTAWALWKARNETVWEAKVPGVDAICQEAVALASDFLEAKSKVMVTTGGLGGPFRWQRPPADVWKLNMACHSSSISSRIGLGILIRDSEGAVMAVLEDSLMRNNELLQVHAKAVLVVLKFAYDVGLRFLLVEVENQELCSLIQAGSPCFDPIGVIVDDICFWIPLFSSICFGVSKKICNKAAQALATEAASSLLL
uniref:Reverse transcriptase domain-containing protein n=1 Tax=Fagus sylvatica TaxID=28930 RepID=A0A2N9F3X0_FAGSY